MRINIRQFITLATLFTICIALAGCGSGGGSAAQKPKANASLKTSGLVPTGTLVSALYIDLVIPYGVTAATDPLTNEPVKSVVQLVGTIDPAQTLNSIKYVAPTPTSTGLIKLTYYAYTGFTPADSIIIELDLTNGFSTPTKNDFNITRFDYGTISSGSLGADMSADISYPNPNSLINSVTSK